jgi:glycosyltransferase involved in cell wall biosynthesis
VERIYLFVGFWQEQYFTRALQLSHRKLITRSVHIANHAYGRNNWYVNQLPRLAEKVGADIVHLTFPVPLNRRYLKSPVVTTLHDLYPYDAPANFGFPRVLAHRLLLRQCLYNSDRIACVSDFTLSRLAALFAPEVSAKAVRIYNVVEPLHILERRPTLKSLNGQPFLLCVAQHRGNKNIQLLLEGFAALLAEGVASNDASLIIVGSAGPETPRIVRAIAKLKLQGRVILAQGITDAELAWLYKNTQLVLCTSIVEGFGLPLAEAMRYGARVVCSDIPAFREVGGEKCTFFKLTDASPVRNFTRACERALRESPGSAAHSSPFCAETIAAQYIDLYSGLLQSRAVAAA